ncbi:hypothetical protein ABZT17_26865 [Streptomyces sp. NPDC005648]|uniref:hypothetical protein n=1 Tax=Streptomyces sp. NPDC005648 TaxID=3157044 RepID=UPI0033A14208
MIEPAFPQTFVAQRDEDLTGVSGEGVVAEGVQFSDGWVVTHWLDQPPMNEPKTDVWHNKGAQPFERIHGHGGATRIVWSHEVAAARRELLADIAEAYDVPPVFVGPEAERAYLHRQMSRALAEVRHDPIEGVFHRKRLGAALADVVMPIIEQLQKQRDDALAANGRAYGLARAWQHAHGSAMFLVRAAGAELHDVLDESEDALADVVPQEQNAQASNSGAEDGKSALVPDLLFDSARCPHCAEHPPRHLLDGHVILAHADLPPCTATFATDQAILKRCAFRVGHRDGEYGHWHASVREGLGRTVWSDSHVGATPHRAPEPATATEATEGQADGACRTPRQRGYKAVNEYLQTLPWHSLATRTYIWRAVNRALDAAGHSVDPETLCQLPHEMEA